MRLTPGKNLELTYKSVAYTFVISGVEPDGDGIALDILMSNEFRHRFKVEENLSRWSPHRFQKFVITNLRDIIAKEGTCV